jgi:hypothetical protein
VRERLLGRGARRSAAVEDLGATHSLFLCLNRSRTAACAASSCLLVRMPDLRTFHRAPRPTAHRLVTQPVRATWPSKPPPHSTPLAQASLLAPPLPGQSGAVSGRTTLMLRPSLWRSALKLAHQNADPVPPPPPTSNTGPPLLPVASTTASVDTPRANCEVPGPPSARHRRKGGLQIDGRYTNPSR